MASSILGKNGFCPHIDPDYDGPSNFWCDDCAEIKDEIRDRKQRRYEIAKDVMAAMIGVDQYTQRHALPTYAEIATCAADALLAELEREDAD